MSELDRALERLKAHEGVEHILLLGGDGLPVRHLGERGALDVDTVAAMIPGLGSACATLARAAALGPLGTAVLDFERGVVVVATLANDLLLALVLRPGVAFAGLLRDLRRERAGLARLL
jgi:predicted regulator of Ras-like GTPase activity (Roadblock/LC7/MglB family)